METEMPGRKGSGLGNRTSLKPKKRTHYQTNIKICAHRFIYPDPTSTVQNTGRRCKFPATSGSDYCFRHVQDRVRRKQRYALKLREQMLDKHIALALAPGVVHRLPEQERGGAAITLNLAMTDLDDGHTVIKRVDRRRARQRRVLEREAATREREAAALAELRQGILPAKFRKRSTSSGYAGVTWQGTPLGKPWRARYHTPQHNYHLGCFATAEEAAAVRNKYIKDLLLAGRRDPDLKGH